ncbi:MAG: GC-type dockerin domain-anchored protein [Phycisphaerales bacterium]
MSLSKKTAILLSTIHALAGHAIAQAMPQPGDLLVSAIDSQTGLPDVFVITPNGLVGETGLLPNEYTSTVELAPMTPIDSSGLVFTVLDNGSGMLRHTYFSDGANEGGPVFKSLIDRELGFDSFDNPIVGFQNPDVAFEDPLFGFTPGIFGLTHPIRANMPDFFEDPLFGFEDPLFGFEDPLFGFEDPLFGFTANSAVVSYSTLNEEYQFSISQGTVIAGLAFPRAFFIDPDEINAFDGIDGELHRNYAGFAVFCNDGPAGAGVYLAPLDRTSIEMRSLELYAFATGVSFDDVQSIHGMHIDPAIARIIVPATDAFGTRTLGGEAVTEEVIYAIANDGTVSELTRGGELQEIGDMVVSPDGTIYVVDSSTAAGKIIAIDGQTGTQTVIATGGDVFENPLSISVVGRKSTVVEVTTTADFHDANPGDGYAGNASFQTSLRSAIEEANAQGGSHTIVLPAGTYAVNTLPEIDIEESNITIVGEGAATTIITGANDSRIFTVLDDSSLKLKGVTLRDGRAGVGNGGIIFANGPVALEEVVLSGGFAGDHGGGIYTTSDLHVYKSHFSGNTANDNGGGIYAIGSDVTIDRSSFFENEALRGGAFYGDDAKLSNTSTTYYLNLSFWEGGAIRSVSSQPVRFLHCTFLENEAGVFPNNPSAGGLDSTGSSMQPTIKSCVFAYNGFDGDQADVTGSIASAEYSLFTTLDGASFGSLDSVMAGDNPSFAGIPTQLGVTYAFAPMAGSPIIDAAATDEFPPFDQLGFNRLQDGNGDLSPAPDMGAYEQTGICVADLTGDGTLNFFDVSAFLSAYNAMNPIADFTGDGVFNFFDVSAFLGAYNAGCP